jgi:hypothetical protein
LKLANFSRSAAKKVDIDKANAADVAAGLKGLQDVTIVPGNDTKIEPAMDRVEF